MIKLYFFQNDWDFNSSFVLPGGATVMIEIVVGSSLKGEGPWWSQANKEFAVNKIVALLENLIINHFNP